MHEVDNTSMHTRSLAPAELTQQASSFFFLYRLDSILQEELDFYAPIPLHPVCEAISLVYVSVSYSNDLHVFSSIRFLHRFEFSRDYRSHLQWFSSGLDQSPDSWICSRSSHVRHNNQPKHASDSHRRSKNSREDGNLRIGAFARCSMRRLRRQEPKSILYYVVSKFALLVP